MAHNGFIFLYSQRNLNEPENGKLIKNRSYGNLFGRRKKNRVI